MQLPHNALTASDVAKRLTITPQYVARLCKQGVFPGAVKLPGLRGPWLVPKDELPLYAAWCRAHDPKKPGRPPRGQIRRRRR
jgi:hypothetical protein